MMTITGIEDDGSKYRGVGRRNDFWITDGRDPTGKTDPEGKHDMTR